MDNTFPEGSDDAPSTIIRALPSSELSEGRPSHHSDAQAGGMAAGGGDGEHGQRIRRVEKEQVYNNIFHGHCRSRSLARSASTADAAATERRRPGPRFRHVKWTRTSTSNYGCLFS